MSGARAVFLADQRHIDDVVFVVGLGDGAADLGLHPLCMRQRRREATGDVPRHMFASDGDRVDVHEVAFIEDGDRSGAGAHVDERDTEVALVGDQGAETGGMGGHDPVGDLEMGAAHADLEVAHGAAGRGHKMDIDPQPLAEHAARVPHRRAVDRVADGSGVNDVAVGGLRRQLDVLLDTPDVALADLVMADRDLEALVVRGGRPAADAYDDVPDVLATHLLGGRYG